MREIQFREVMRTRRLYCQILEYSEPEKENFNRGGSKRRRYKVIGFNRRRWYASNASSRMNVTMCSGQYQGGEIPARWYHILTRSWQNQIATRLESKYQTRPRACLSVMMRLM